MPISSFSFLDKLYLDFCPTHPLMKTFRGMYNRNCLFARSRPHGIGEVRSQHLELRGH